MDSLSATTVARLLSHLQSGAGLLRFFSKATSSVWIPSLREHGVFSSPTPARHDGSSVSFPRWPQAEYLARITPQDPTQVAQTIEVIPDTDNVWILRELADAIAQMPWDLAKRFRRRVTAWLAVPHAATMLVEPVRRLVQLGLEAGEVQESFPLVAALFAVHEARPARHVEGLDDRTFDIPPDAGGRLETWQYRRSMEELLPLLAAADWRLAVGLLLQLLDQTLTIERGDEARKGGYDLSYIWYRRLDRSGEAPVEDVAETVVGTLIKVCEGLISTPDDLPELIDLLMDSPWGVAWRVALHTLAESPPSSMHDALTRRLLEDQQLFSHADTRREYNHLLSAAFENLSDEGRQLILSWMHTKPEWMSDEDPATFSRWQRDRLAPLQGKLPDDVEEQFAALVVELGQPHFHEGLSGEMASWTGPTSPLSPAELSVMSAEQVLDFMRSWTPPGDWQSPTPEGLGRVAAGDVEQRSAEYLALVDDWDGLPPTLARSLVTGTAAAVRSGSVALDRHVVERLAVLTAAGIDVDRKRPGSDAAVDALADEDPSWAWFRREVVSLLEVAADRDAITDPDAGGPAVDILRAVVHDPDPSVEDEERFGASMGPVTYAINTTRGQAAHSAIALLAWLRRHDRDDSTATYLLRLLDDQLQDESPAVRSVFGTRFNQLAGLHLEWLSARVDLVFTKDVRGVAAWHAYLEWNRPWERTLPILWSEYVHRTSEVPPDGAAPLLSHLLAIFVAGTPAAEGVRYALTAAWSQASDEARAQCLHGLAEGLGQLSPEAIARARAFIAGRVEEIGRRPAEPLEREAAAMGWLFSNGHFTAEDVVAWLPLLVRASPRLEREPELYELLASYAESGQWVVDSVLATRLLFESDEGRWAAYSARGAIARTVHAAIAHGGPAERRAGEGLRDYLLSTGRFEPEWLETAPGLG